MIRGWGDILGEHGLLEAKGIVLNRHIISLLLILTTNMQIYDKKKVLTIEVFHSVILWTEDPSPVT